MKKTLILNKLYGVRSKRSGIEQILLNKSLSKRRLTAAVENKSFYSECMHLIKQTIVDILALVITSTRNIKQNNNSYHLFSSRVTLSIQCIK